MRAQPPGGAGPAGRSSVSAGGCHLPSGHASLPRVRQRSRRATGTLRPLQPLPQLLPASGWEGALRSPKFGLSAPRIRAAVPLCFIPRHGAPPAPHKTSALTPSIPSPPGSSQSLQTQPSSQDALQGGPQHPGTPRCSPGGGFGELGARMELGTCRQKAPGRFAAGSKAPARPGGCLLGFNTSLRPLQVSGKTIIIIKKKSVFSKR